MQPISGYDHHEAATTTCASHTWLVMAAAVRRFNPHGCDGLWRVDCIWLVRVQKMAENVKKISATNNNDQQWSTSGYMWLLYSSSHLPWESPNNWPSKYRKLCPCPVFPVFTAQHKKHNWSGPLTSLEWTDLQDPASVCLPPGWWLMMVDDIVRLMVDGWWLTLMVNGDGWCMYDHNGGK